MDTSTATAYSDIQDSANTKLPIMELNQIHQVYFSDAGEVEAIRDVNLSIQPGEFVGIVGQSGCGKSTLLSIISGLITPTSGQVVIKGNPVNGTSSQTGYMLQHDTLFEWRTILDNVMLGPEIQGLDKKKARKRANDLLDRYGLAAFKDKFPQELSGGMRQRAALARTMCTQPEILLLDEPFSALDYQTRLAMSDEIGIILKKEGCTVIMVTHDISEAISMSDRIVVLSARPGRIQSEHQILFPSAGGASLSPMASRDTPEFGQYFQTIWKELDFHVSGSK
ncbi:MAG: ABC transporter ATP-binding protein [Desulfobacula sp.]|nr:ABC transporter ATP-binding protein [Desulfobacula sp.]